MERRVYRDLRLFGHPDVQDRGPTDRTAFDPCHASSVKNDVRNSDSCVDHFYLSSRPERLGYRDRISVIQKALGP